MKRPYAACLLMCSFLTVRFAYPAQEDSIKVASQNPSPMTESVRKHGRIEQKEHPGIAFEIRDFFSKPVQVFIPQKSTKSKTFDLLLHFHGAAFVTEHAAGNYRGNIIGATLSVGSGSKIYNDTFQDTTKFLSLIDSILAEGGRIDSTDLLPYTRLAADAVSKKSRKRFLITHSEIFPGTFVSTTEATDFLLQSLSIKRVPVLRWGPLGMQELSYGRKNHFEVLGFAGNTARDHVDHLHGLYWFLNRLLGL